MRLKNLANKEVIDVETGQKLGVLGKADLIIEPETGNIRSLVIMNQGLMSMGSSKKALIIDWEQIATIGEDTILLKKS
ncbi:YlmC/YmxH family sporulation protein [Halobacillus yeomjeoni]|uniref:YlmC/YmxH family sporulation protein n=1 Tax=Halobacillus yeomjeoni TaxID=311194 RepID=A0A931HTW2_9BACI|nr:YlmC/YmxH family sporulation protein [Halobacillus yeomjeoni]MBH0229323.1 YlmC/YmxH family sporulation protein [Halobacillus yeomjeoni]MCA0983278.1 YlmC/YmxH family sporulation protein [Halobacillus yeomjeoni]